MATGISKAKKLRQKESDFLSQGDQQVVLDEPDLEITFTGSPDPQAKSQNPTLPCGGQNRAIPYPHPLEGLCTGPLSSSTVTMTTTALTTLAFP